VRFNVEKALLKERGRLQLLQLRREMQQERKESKRLRERRELQRAREFRPRPEAASTTTTTTTISIKQTTLMSPGANDPDDAASAHVEAPPQQRHHRPPQLPPLPLDGRRSSSPRQQRGRSHSWAEREHPRDLQAHNGLEGGSVGPALRAFPWLIDAPIMPSPRTRSISAEWGDHNERAPSPDDDGRTRVYNYSFDDEEQHQQQLTTMLYREVADDENALELTEVVTAVSREASATAGPESEVEVETGGNESWPLEDSRKWLSRHKGKEKLDAHYEEEDYEEVMVANGLVEYASSSSFPPLAQPDRTPYQHGW
jgi:hypothetical protein